VVERKKQHIKGKLQDKFPSAEKCFSALDEDGGGSLDRCPMRCMLVAQRSSHNVDLSYNLDLNSNLDLNFFYAELKSAAV
jgi:hypothetical protein